MSTTGKTDDGGAGRPEPTPPEPAPREPAPREPAPRDPTPREPAPPGPTGEARRDEAKERDSAFGGEGPAFSEIPGYEFTFGPGYEDPDYEAGYGYGAMGPGAGGTELAGPDATLAGPDATLAGPDATLAGPDPTLAGPGTEPEQEAPPPAVDRRPTAPGTSGAAAPRAPLESASPPQETERKSGRKTQPSEGEALQGLGSATADAGVAQPAAARPGTAPPGSAGKEAPPPPAPVVADTPALRGKPGGPGLAPAAGQPQEGPAGAQGGERVHVPRFRRRELEPSMSAWQRSLSTWQDSDVDWQRTHARAGAAEADWNRIGSALGQAKRRRAWWVGSQAAPPSAPPPPAMPPPATPPGEPTGSRSTAPADEPPAAPAIEPSAAEPAPPAPAARIASAAPPDASPFTTAPAGAAPSPAAAIPSAPPKPAPPKPGLSSAGPSSAAPLPARRPPAPAAPRTPPPGPAPRARRRAVRAGIGLAIVIALGAAATLTFETVAGKPGPHRGGTSLTAGFPPAHLADNSFTTDPAQQARGIQQALTRVVAANGKIVAVGSQSGGRIQRAQFFVSTDGGHTWRVAPTHSARGGDPPPGHMPMLVAGGRGAWLALGPDSIWTSPNGTSWTLSADHGIAPQQLGDHVWVVTRTGSGFLAGGRHLSARGGGPGTAVIWTSRDGVNWQRHNAAHLGPVPGGGHITSINYAAAHGRSTVIAGETVKKRAVPGGNGTVLTHSFGVWRSNDGGATWTHVDVPVSNGAQDMVSGVAAGAAGFIVVRPGHTQRAGTDAVSYVSADGSGWRYGGQIAAAGKIGFVPNVVKGSENGFVVGGQTSGKRLIAFFSTDGRSWRQAGDFGSAASEQINSATTAPGGAVVAVGASAGDPLSQRPVLALSIPGRGVVPVDIGGIPHASVPELSVNSVAEAAGERVAVGSANGEPVIWSARAGGSWSRVTSAGTLARPGAQALSGVTHGAGGWLVVGWVVAGAPEHPIVVTSRDGAAWQAADGQGAFAAAGVYTFQAAANPSGYVVVGKRVRGSQSTAAAWWSTGLSTWQPASDAGNADLDGTDASRQMLAVTATPSGFAAVGSHGARPATWTSANGKQWLLSDLPLPPGATSAMLTQVAAHGRDLVAMGNGTGASGTAPFAAVSADGGKSWSEAALPHPGGAASVTALAAGSRGFTAAGVFGTQADGNVVIWSSADGRAWKATTPAGTGLSGRGLQEITGLTASGTALTGVGFTASPLGEHPTLWMARQR